MRCLTALVHFIVLEKLELIESEDGVLPEAPMKSTPNPNPNPKKTPLGESVTGSSVFWWSNLYIYIHM